MKTEKHIDISHIEQGDKFKRHDGHDIEVLKINDNGQTALVSTIGSENAYIMRLDKLAELELLEGAADRIEDEFYLAARAVDMVVRGTSPALLICGTPGVGKTHLTKTAFSRAGLIEDVHYIVETGHVSAIGLYRLLHENNDKIIVFDDADSVFEDKKSVNLLKGALDSYRQRTISWHTDDVVKKGLPRKFDFNGRVIFISNYDESKIDEAVKTRCLCKNFDFTKKEVIQILRNVVGVIETDTPDEFKNEVLEYLESIADELGAMSKLSIRTLIHAIRLRKDNADDWKDMVLQLV